MGKGKPRKEPDKEQNLYGSKCSYSEVHNGVGICEAGIGDWNICKGNPHNCIKTKYHNLASLDDTLKDKHAAHNNGYTDTNKIR